MRNDIEKRIEEILKENSIEYSADIKQKLEMYYSFLVEYNQKVNLTSITDKDEVFLKHFADCMLGVSLYKHNSTLCDIGTGAGFPGVVIKIVRPDIHLTLVDSLNKRIVFLNELIGKLGLTNVDIIHARAEDESLKSRYLNTFDYVVARAVANMTTLTEYCLPYVSVGGCFVAYKSEDISQELLEAKKCITLLGGDEPIIKHYKLDYTTNRNLVLINKISRTSNKYPRGLNKPRLQPIK